MALILVLIGFKMALSGFFTVPTPVALGAIVLLLGLSIAASLIKARRDAPVLSSQRTKYRPPAMLPRMAISTLLGRLGLDRPDLRAWAMYDWAISGFQTIVMTAVFPIFFARVPAGLLSPPEATARYADLNTLYLAVVALLSPVLGAVADYLGIARRLLFCFMLLGVVSTAGFALIGPATCSSPRCCSCSP